MVYAPLWCKSNFSFLEGASHPEELVEEAHPVGITSIAITDRDGDYRVFNLPPGAYTVTAYAAGHSYEAGAVTLAAGQDAAVDLALDDAPTSTLTGEDQLVNPQAGEATSVVLIVESTFDPTLVRGDSPAGLRAPGPAVAPNVTGRFSIEGVPAGRYVILAGFENDRLVRDTSDIGGTDIVHQAIAAGQAGRD